jgi:molybdopterin synthase sulfur carrier subunit
MDVHYLSWLRNRIGKSSESITLPPEIATLDEFVAWLVGQHPSYHALHSYRSVINASVNGSMVQDWSACAVSDKDKINFFSPLAGG